MDDQYIGKRCPACGLYLAECVLCTPAEVEAATRRKLAGPPVPATPSLEAIKARLALAAGAWAVSAHRPEIDLTLQKIAQVDAPALVAEVERLTKALTALVDDSEGQQHRLAWQDACEVLHGHRGPEGRMTGRRRHMGEIVDVSDELPHQTASVRCTACKMRFVSVSPVGPDLTTLECLCGATRTLVREK